MSKIEENATSILEALAAQPRPDGGDAWVSGRTIADITGIHHDDINDAVTILVESGLVEWLQEIGTAPYKFSAVWINPRGRIEINRVLETVPQISNAGIAAIKYPIPVGSPFGFTDQDWELVLDRKVRSNILYVVMGFQFQSEYYDNNLMLENTSSMFSRAVDEYNQLTSSLPIELSFRPLAAGYGEHLFNKIARDIISADIAVFETSDQNPNVMIELGVALTWGVRVFPIKMIGCESPPSDISGQTWVEYRENGSDFIDSDHDRKLLLMVQRAARKKGIS